MRLCIVQPSLNEVSETFLRAHAELLPFQTTVVNFSKGLPCIGERPILSQSLLLKEFRNLMRKVLIKPWDWEHERAFTKVFQKKADIVLAEYGPTGVRVCKSAKLAKVPLVVHFHGYDASKLQVLEANRINYQALFEISDAIIVVSNKMVEDLVKLGASRKKLFLNPCGVDTEVFKGSRPAEANQIFLTVGRFVEKKAPYLSILAFASVVNKFPDAKLRMIGSGPLLGPCQDLVQALGLCDSVVLLGACSHKKVVEEMSSARAFVQHSIKSSDGDCEGTPVSIMEAQSMGLPVVATKHAGIADVVEHEKTGFLVDEKDVDTMSEYMLVVARDYKLAAKMGKAGRIRIQENYSMKKSIDNLASILKNAAN